LFFYFFYLFFFVFFYCLMVFFFFFNVQLKNETASLNVRLPSYFA